MKKFIINTFLAFSLIFIFMFSLTMIIEYKNKDAINTKVNVEAKINNDKTIEVPDNPPKVEANLEFSKFYFFSGLVIEIVTPILFFIYGGVDVIKKKKYKRKITEGFMFSILYFIFSEIIIFPKYLMGSFYRKKLVGLSNYTLLSYLQDYGKDELVTILIGIPCVLIIYLIYSKMKKWYIPIAVLLVGFSVLSNYFYPYLDQMQNELVDMKDGELKNKILALSKEAKIDNLEIKVINKSKETSAMNAYMTGIGNSRRIVFWDTTLNGMTEQEILSVAAHEMGHYQLNHINKSLVLGSVGIVFLCIILHLIMKFFKGEGYNKDVQYLPQLIFVITILNLLSLPIENAYSRKIEVEADKYAIELTNDPQTNGLLEIRFINSNLSPVDVSGVYKWFAYTHPTTKERIEISNSYYQK